MIDLRSDTITKPTPAMRKAMAEAEVGDDVYREDPTVNRLEKMGAELTGKEESLFVASGCMGNLLSLMIEGGRGKEVLTSASSHIVQHEIGAVSAIANTLPVIVPSKEGIIIPSELKRFIKGECYDMSNPSMIEVENTTGGLIYPLETMKEIFSIAKENNLKVHLDGARIFNAVVETGIPLSSYAKECTDITFCLSKGLGAPAGSLLSGDRDFIHRARTYRKMLGSGMRQIGILAAAGIYALEHNVERLREDHEHAAAIRDALTASTWAKVKTAGTNIIFFEPTEERIEDVVEDFQKNGFLILNEGGEGRIVTNLGVSDEDTDKLCAWIRNRG
jgi:Threonine aldolase